MERMLCALAPLVQTTTGQRYGVPSLPNEEYRALAEQARFDKHAKAYFDHLLPKLNENPGELIDLLCRHPGLNPNIGGSGKNLATFVVLPSNGFLLQLDILTCFLAKSAIEQGCSEAVRRLEYFLSFNAEGRVPGYEITIFCGLTMSDHVEIAPGLDIIDYQRAAERGLVTNEPPGPTNTMPDYAAMGALVLAREMTWGPCLVVPLSARDEFPNSMPEFRWLPGCGTGIVFDFLSICTSHQVQMLVKSFCAPEFVDVSPGFVSRSGYGYMHSEHRSQKDLSEEHIRHLQEMLRLWSHFQSDKRDRLEWAISRLSSSIQRNRGRFSVQDRIFDAAIALEIMYELEPPEITNKLATRAARLLAKETDSRIEVFNRVQKFYKARSQIAHGASRKGSTIIGAEEAAKLGFELASDTLYALLDNGKFPNWIKLILSA